MARVIATFLAVWLAIGVAGVLLQYLGVPIPNTVVSLVGLVIAAIAAYMVHRRRRRIP